MALLMSSHASVLNYLMYLEIISFFLAFQRTWIYIHYSGCLLLYSLKNIKIELNKEWFKWIWGSEGGLRLCVHTGLSVPRCDFALSDVNK